MFRLIRKRMKGEKGFTLIELLVVIIIIAILAAIAIPTFLGQRNKAYDASTKSVVRNAMMAIETIYVDSRTFTGTVAADLTAIEPSMTYTAVAAAATAPGAFVDKQVSFTIVSADSYQLGATSKSGKIFGVTVVKIGAGAGSTFNPVSW